ncbi:unnamed protein product, partial [Heterosigma akashiwo]
MKNVSNLLLGGKTVYLLLLLRNSLGFAPAPTESCCSQRPRPSECSTHHSLISSLGMVGSSDRDGLGAARALLFQDQHRAMTDQAEVEGELLNQPMPELELCAARQSARRSSGSSAASRGG